MKTLNTVRMVVEQKEDAYAVLGIDRGASDDAVRVAYRRMAKKHHPDKGGSEEEFLRVQEAYQVLSDPDRRSVYDHAGWGGFDKSFPGSPGGVHDMPDFFQHIFGGGVPHHPGAGAPRPGHRFNYFHMGPVQGRRASSTASTGSSDSKKRRLPDRGIDLAVSLQEAYNGATIRYRLKRKRYKGNTQAFSPTACSQCDGAGQVPVRPPDMPNFLIMMPIAMAVCPKCAGLGVSVSEKEMETIIEMVDVQVPKYCPENYTITIHGKTDELPGMETGNVIFTVKYDISEVDRTQFKIDPPHIISSLTITLAECLQGFSKDVVFVDGKHYRVILPPYTSLFTDPKGRNNIHDVIRVVPSEGFYADHRMLRRGDWILHFSVVFPVGNTMSLCRSLGTTTRDHDETENENTTTVIRLDTLPTLSSHRKEHHATTSSPQDPHGTTFHTQECRQS